MPKEGIILVGAILGCTLVEVLTNDDSLFGHVVAGSMCAIGSVVAGKIAYDHYDAAFRAGKNSAQSINTVSKKTKEKLLLK